MMFYYKRGNVQAEDVNASLKAAVIQEDAINLLCGKIVARRVSVERGKLIILQLKAQKVAPIH